MIKIRYRKNQDWRNNYRFYFSINGGHGWVVRNNLPSLTYQLLCRLDSGLIQEFKNDIRTTLKA